MKNEQCEYIEQILLKNVILYNIKYNIKYGDDLNEVMWSMQKKYSHDINL